MTTSSFKKTPKTSPLPNEPLPTPGGSLREKFNELAYENAGFWLAFVAVIWVLTLLEFVRWLLNDKPTLTSIGMYIFIAGVSTVIAFFKLRRMRSELQNIRRGLEGEEWMGQFLEENCRVMEYSIYHDIPGDNFNIDHILIGPGGIFLIETKTMSRLPNCDNKIFYDGQSILINRFAPDRDPIVQAKALSRHLQTILAGSTGVDPASIQVQPVVVYPGWYVKGSSSGKEVWVLNHNQMLKFIQNAYMRLSLEQIAMFSHHLEMHIRAKK